MVPETTAYLDHAATTPMVPEAVAAFAEHAARAGNASSLHDAGRSARRVIEESRELIADRFGALPSEVVFTSGGTEANNLALKGFAWAGRADGRERIIVSAIEHHAVLDPVDWLLEHEGVEVAIIPVDRSGLLEIKALRDELAVAPASVALVSVMAANNEVGTIQPVAEVVAAAAEYGVRVHSDAVQAAGHLRLDFAASGLDAMTITAHKLGGPIGIGALFLRREVDPVPLLHGGGQERQVRSGTVPTPLIASFAAAVDAAATHRAERSARLEALRNRLEEGIRRADPTALVNGADAGAEQPPAQHPARRIPRLRGRDAAAHARRRGHRMFGRVGLCCRRAAGKSRPARHGPGCRRRLGARCASASGTRRLMPTSTRCWRRCRPSSSAPARPAS